MFGGLGMWEVLLIFLVVLLLFGAKRLPEIGSSLGKGIREFKGSLRELEGELKVPEDRERGARRRETRSETPSRLSDDDDAGDAPGDADAASRDRPRRLRAETLAPEAAADRREKEPATGSEPTPRREGDAAREE